MSNPSPERLLFASTAQAFLEKEAPLSRVRELHAAGISSFIISVDAADVEAHEKNRGLPGVCEKIVEANKVFKELGVHSTASVTMSRLVDYDKLPAFLAELGFKSVHVQLSVNQSRFELPELQRFQPGQL